MYSPLIRSVALVALTLVIMSPAVAQTPPVTPPEPETFARIGLFGGLNINFHSTSFEELTGVPSCCPEFLSGNGIGGAVGLVYEQALGGAVEVAMRIGWQSRGGTLEALETMPVIDTRTGAMVDGEVRHVLEAGLSSVTIEPMLSVGFGRIVRLHLGPHLGFMTGTTFAQREELSKPEEFGTFENNRRVRNDTSGTIPNASSFDAGIVLGATFDIPLNRERTFIAAPEVFFTADLTNATSDLSWNNHTLRFGVALKYVLLRETAPIVHVTPTPEVTPLPVAPASASIRALGVNADGTERADVTMHIEEFVSVNMRPLLNYVFFDEASSELPTRYQRATPESFNRYGLHSLDAIGTYYHMLNVIGQRLREKPATRVTLVGCTSGAAIEPGGRALARSRAMAVRQYLSAAWGIDSARMRIEARELPAVPSDSSTADGRAENRRVEILVDNPDVLAPVVTIDTLRTVTPPVIRFRPTYASTIGARRWSVTALHRDASIASFAGDGALPQTIDWETNADQLAIPSAGDSLR
ncbi:MAG: OmpA family protein, partial [bacterium]|nr:OmpA family protein [Candidatus Kapabacteria bacterium]